VLQLVPEFEPKYGPHPSHAQLFTHICAPAFWQALLKLQSRMLLLPLMLLTMRTSDAGNCGHDHTSCVASKVKDVDPPILRQVPVQSMLALVVIVIFVVIFLHVVQDFVCQQSTHV
jgi:hypothetical protein